LPAGVAAELAARLNDSISEAGARRRYVTAIFLRLDATHMLEVVNARHPILVSGDRQQ